MNLLLDGLIVRMYVYVCEKACKNKCLTTHFFFSFLFTIIMCLYVCGMYACMPIWTSTMQADDLQRGEIEFTEKYPQTVGIKKIAQRAKVNEN